MTSAATIGKKDIGIDPSVIAKIRPHPKRFAMVRDDAVKQTDAGIYLPEAEREMCLTGTVIVAGSACSEIESGDRVFVPKYCGHELRIGNEDILFVDQDDLISVLPEDVRVEGVDRG